MVTIHYGGRVRTSDSLSRAICSSESPISRDSELVSTHTSPSPAGGLVNTTAARALAWQGCPKSQQGKQSSTVCCLPLPSPQAKELPLLPRVKTENTYQVPVTCQAPSKAFSMDYVNKFMCVCVYICTQRHTRTHWGGY